MDQQALTEQKTEINISQLIGIAVLLVVSAGGAGALLIAGSQLSQTSTNTAGVTSRTANTNANLAAGPLADETIPPKELLTADAPASATTVATALDPSVTVKITSTLEGTTVNGDTPVTAELTDPNHKAAGVRIRLYSKVLPDYLQGTPSAIDTTAPYNFDFNLGMYPSGEYRYAAEAVKFNNSIPGADASVVIASSDTMVTWVRSCYYLGFPDVTLTGPTTTVHPEDVITLTAKVKNNIRGNCVNTYTLTPTPPNGWPTTFSPASPQIFGNNETKTITLTTHVPAGVNPGAYLYKFKAQRDSTGFEVEKSVTVTVGN